MPNIKSAIKRVSVIEHKTLRNKMVKSATKTAIKKFDTATANKTATAECGAPPLLPSIRLLLRALSLRMPRTVKRRAWPVSWPRLSNYLCLSSLSVWRGFFYFAD